MSSTTNTRERSVRRIRRKGGAHTDQVQSHVRLRGSSQANGQSPVKASPAAATPSKSPTGKNSLTIDALKTLSGKYVTFLQRKADGSLTTSTDREALAERLLAFLRERKYQNCGPVELEEYFFYLSHRHTLEKGGDGRRQPPLSPESVASYYRNLKPMFAWFVEHKYLAENPLDKVAKPKSKPPQKEPLTQRCVDELLEASRLSQHPKRDEALLLFLLDTGCRNSEVCALRLNDINLKHGYAQVVGKGNKKRPVYFTTHTAEKLGAYS